MFIVKGVSELYDYVTIFYERIRINTLAVINVTRESTWNLFTPLLLISSLMLDCPRLAIPVSPSSVWNSIVRIDISYFLFTTHLLFHSPAERKWKSWNFLSVVNSHECFNDSLKNVVSAAYLPRTFALLFYNRKLKKTERSYHIGLRITSHNSFPSLSLVILIHSIKDNLASMRFKGYKLSWVDAIFAIIARNRRNRNGKCCPSERIDTPFSISYGKDIFV